MNQLKLYSDKKSTVKFNLAVEGASLSKTFARILLESKDQTLLFRGVVSAEGVCTIEIPPLHEEGLAGTAILEVIADSSFFTPMSTEFTVEASKKVKVTEAEVIKEPARESSVSVSLVPDKRVAIVESAPTLPPAPTPPSRNERLRSLALDEQRKGSYGRALVSRLTSEGFNARLVTAHYWVGDLNESVGGNPGSLKEHAWAEVDGETVVDIHAKRFDDLTGFSTVGVTVGDYRHLPRYKR